MTFEAAKRIFKTDQILVGYTGKTHGSKGQLTVNMFLDFEQDFLFIKKEAFLIPFLIEKELTDFEAAKPFVKLKKIDTIDTAMEFTGKQIFFPVSELVEKDFEVLNPEFFVGFILYENKHQLGEIYGFIDHKYNPIFELKTPDGEKMLPLSAIEFIDFDIFERKLTIRYKQ